MQRFVMSSAAYLWLAAGAAFLAAQESKDAKPAAGPNEGTLTVGERTYKLSHVVAYETKADDETMVTVLASDRKTPSARSRRRSRKGRGATTGSRSASRTS